MACGQYEAETEAAQVNHPDVIQGTYTAGRRTLEYWTRCEHCPKRRRCPHDDEPGRIRFYIDGVPKVLIQGVITLQRIDAAVREYLECEEDDLPEDVAVPPRQLEMAI